MRKEGGRIYTWTEDRSRSLSTGKARNEVSHQIKKKRRGRVVSVNTKTKVKKRDTYLCYVNAKRQERE